PYSSSHLIHTLSDLAGLSYDRYEPAKSLVSPQFVVAPRWIGDPYRKGGLREFDHLPLDKAERVRETVSSGKTQNAGRLN
ncbi:hypothetical protein, partial [Streptomyces sp. SID13031]